MAPRRPATKKNTERPVSYRRVQPGDSWPEQSKEVEEKFGAPGKLYPLIGESVALPTRAGDWIEGRLEQVLGIKVRVALIGFDKHGQMMIDPVTTTYKTEVVRTIWMQ